MNFIGKVSFEDCFHQQMEDKEKSSLMCVNELNEV